MGASQKIVDFAAMHIGFSSALSSLFPSQQQEDLGTTNHLTHSLNHGDEPFLRSRQLCSYSRISQHFMEPDGSLSCSQEPSTGP
jgi:hypothetical protein